MYPYVACKCSPDFLIMVIQFTTPQGLTIKARIDQMQENIKCSLCDDREETINLIISECSKITQGEYKTRHDGVRKVIHWEMCKKFKFDYTNT